MNEFIRDILEEIKKNSKEFKKAIRDVFLWLAGAAFALFALIAMVKTFGFASIFITFLVLLGLAALAFVTLVRFAYILDEKDRK